MGNDRHTPRHRATPTNPAGWIPAGSPGVARLRYEPALDGLRAVAVGVVVWFHDRPSSLPGGFLGVSVFFTLSGFLICRVIINELATSGRLSLRKFWSRRFRRLVPASSLLLVAIATLTLIDPNVWARSIESTVADILAAFGQVANWWFLLSGTSYGALFAAPSPVQHFWSLAVEEQFYLFLPLVVYALHLRPNARRLFTILLAGGTLASWIVMWRAGVSDHAYYGTDARFAELAVGCLLALAVDARWWRPPARLAWLGCVAVGGLVALCILTVEREQSAWLYPWGFMATSALTCLMIITAQQPGATRKLLRMTPLPQIGRMSYGIYLIHWPVFLYLTPRRLHASLWVTTAARLVVTLAFASLTFIVVEHPVRTKGRLRQPRTAFLSWLGATILLSSVLLGVRIRSQRPAPRLTETDLAQIAAPTEKEVGIAREVTEMPEPMPPSLLPPGTPVLLVRGDSVGAYLGSATALWGAQHGWAVRNGAVFSCSVRGTMTISGSPCPQIDDDRAEVANGDTGAVLWFVGVNDLTIEVDGLAGRTPEGRQAVIDRLTERAEVFLEAGIPVLVNRMAPPAPLDPNSPYNDLGAVEAMNEAIDELGEHRGIVAVGFDDAMARRRLDRNLRPDGLHTPNPLVGLAFYNSGYGERVLTAIAEARAELSAPAPPSTGNPTESSPTPP